MVGRPYSDFPTGNRLLQSNAITLSYWVNPCSFFIFHQQFNTKIDDVNGNQTRIVRVVGKPADHLNTTTPRRPKMLEHFKGNVAGCISNLSILIFC